MDRREPAVWVLVSLVVLALALAALVALIAVRRRKAPGDRDIEPRSTRDVGVLDERRRPTSYGSGTNSL